MTDNPHEAWDPRSPAVLPDQIGAYDSMRRQTPIAYSDFLGWSVFHLAHTVHILNDPQTFSNAVSSHLNFALRVQSAYLGWPEKRDSRNVELAEDAVRAVYPGSGFAQLPLRFR